MELIEKSGYNVTYAEDQEEYFNLPAFKEDDGCVTTCWGLSFKVRVKVLLSGEIFLQVLTFNKPLQPLKMTVEDPLR